VLVDELARAGVRHAVVCPGSRSTPLAMALAADERMRLHVRLDERSAAYFALGIGLESGLPACLLTTSGTAAAEVHAAVVEAHHARVPLIVCTADRPPELHEVGAPQTVEQANLYAGTMRFACDLGVPDPAAAGSWRPLASRLFAEACAAPEGPGPVHLNVAFREPLDAPPGEAPPGRRDGRPWHSVEAARPFPDPVLAEVLATARQPLIVAGARCGDPELLLATARRGIPLLADPRSGCRQVKRPAPVVAAADALLRSTSFAAAHRPDLVIRLGESWASKIVNSWLDEGAAAGALHVLVDPFGEWRDPGRQVAKVLRARPGDLLRGLLAVEDARPVDPAWTSSWQGAEAVAQRALGDCLDELGEAGELVEPLVARALATAPGVGTLLVASSMPIRDLEWFSAPRPAYPRVLANRGANGIDGVVSTTLGVAASRAVGDGGPVIGLVGDLAFLHDLTALLRAAAGPEPSGRPCGIIIVDNGGGGIFSFLSQARSVERSRFEQLFGTPQATDVAEHARAAGCPVVDLDGSKGFTSELEAWLAQVGRATGPPPVLVCRTDRARNVEVHEELNSAVARALSS
jgi:2-succinyl-5-enolpyruvyl-6-hydroxy-3-cyclohexene-1-carboxylate synthase